jgi:predicted acetyltransferase
MNNKKSGKAIREITSSSEEKAFRDIARYCFNDMIGWSGRIFPLAFGDKAYGVFDGSVLESALVTRNYESMVFGEWRKTTGISFVETLPEHRNADNVSALFRTLLPAERAAGMSLSTLYPFKFGYYEKFGYGYVGGNVFAQFPPDQIVVEKPAGEFVPYEEGGDGLTDMRRLYDEWAARYGLAVRFRLLPSDRFDDDLAFQKDRIVFYRDGGECKGFVRLNKIIVERFVSHIEIRKIAWSDEHAFLALLYFLSKHRDQIREIRWLMPPSLPLQLVMREPRIGLTRQADWMARPFDLEALLTRKLESSGYRGKFRFSVLDEYVPENTGAYIIADGGVERNPISGDNPVPLPVLSSLLFGGYSVEDAWCSGRLATGVLEGARDFFRRDPGIFFGEFF